MSCTLFLSVSSTVAIRSCATNSCEFLLRLSGTLLFSHLARLFQSVFVFEIVSPIVATSLQLQLVQTSVKLVPPWSSISFETCSTLRLKVETKEKRREKERRGEKKREEEGKKRGRERKREEEA